MIRKTERRRGVVQERKRDTRRDYRTILIICEGSKTEKFYFEHFKERHIGLRIEIANADKFTDPVNLVNFTRKALVRYDIEFEKGDSVWCICDVDQIKDEQLLEAKRLADANGIQFALSNPCFEIWYLLHFKYTSGSLSNDELNKAVDEVVRGYKKNKDIFERLPQPEEAIKRCERLIKHHSDQNRNLCTRACNPSTQVYQLVQHIQQIKRENGITV